MTLKSSKRTVFPQSHDFANFLPELKDYVPMAFHDDGWLNYAIGDIRHVPGLEDLFIEVADRGKEKLPGLCNLLPGMRGYRPLIEAIGKLVFEETGLEPVTDNIVLSNGGCSGLWAAILATCDPNDSVVYAIPSFPYWCIFHLTNIYQEPLLFDRPSSYANTFADRLEVVCQERTPRAVILNVPQNPMGYSLDNNQLLKFSALAEKYNFWILLDEVARPFNFKSVKWWGSYLPQDRVVQIDSFTKRFAASGLRLGWLISPEELVKPLRAIFANIQAGVSHAAAEFGLQLLRVIEERDGGNPCVTEIRRRHNELIQIVEGLQGKTELYYEEGLYALYYPPREMDDIKFKQRLEKAKIRLMDGQFQYPDPSIAPRSYRLSIGGDSSFPTDKIRSLFTESD